MNTNGNGTTHGPEKDRKVTRSAAGEASPAAGALATLTDPLMQFRTTWLRAVAYAWVDESFRKTLLYNAVDALYSQFGFVWPWKSVLKLTVKEERSFLWVGDDWVWPAASEKAESVILYVPLRPPTEDAKKHALALAAYYQARPSLLSRDPNEVANAVLSSLAFKFNDRIAEVVSDRSRRSGPLEFAGTAPPRNGFLPTTTSLAEFQVVLISIMAKAWANANYRELIQDGANVGSALQTIRNYSAPWRLNLTIRDDNTAQWDEQTGDWSNLAVHDLLLHLPVAPQEASDQSLALAAYNGTGSQFPLSCCA